MNTVFEKPVFQKAVCQKKLLRLSHLPSHSCFRRDIRPPGNPLTVLNQPKLKAAGEVTGDFVAAAITGRPPTSPREFFCD